MNETTSQSTLATEEREYELHPRQHPEPDPTDASLPRKLRSAREIRSLIRRAAAGDETSIRTLIGPFIGKDETLLQHTVTAKMGVLTTYDFAFLTDRRIGDLEVTPFTGALNVEIAFLDKIDAIVILQPAIPILLRLFFGFMYVAGPLLGLAYADAARLDSGAVPVLLATSAVLGALFAWRVVNPAMKRAFLRLRKSGLILKLTGTSIATFIFADRDKLGVLSDLAARLTEARRLLIEPR